MPTVNAFRIMKLRSLSTISWAVWVGNQGDKMISKPSSMPHQSSQVLWVPKSRKSDIVDLLLKKAYVSGRRAPHPMVRRPVRPHRGRMSSQDVGTVLVLARAAGNNLRKATGARGFARTGSRP